MRHNYDNKKFDYIQKKYQCTCGFERVLHYDTGTMSAGKCPKCKRKFDEQNGKA